MFHGVLLDNDVAEVALRPAKGNAEGAGVLDDVACHGDAGTVIDGDSVGRMRMRGERAEVIFDANVFFAENLSGAQAVRVGYDDCAPEFAGDRVAHDLHVAQPLADDADVGNRRVDGGGDLVIAYRAVAAAAGQVEGFFGGLRDAEVIESKIGPARRRWNSR